MSIIIFTCSKPKINDVFLKSQDCIFCTIELKIVFVIFCAIPEFKKKCLSESVIEYYVIGLECLKLRHRLIFII